MPQRGNLWLAALLLSSCALPLSTSCNRSSRGGAVNTAQGQHNSVNGNPQREAGSTDPSVSEATDDAGASSGEADAAGLSEAHQVVFADRISQGYLLLLAGDRGAEVSISRQQLLELVRSTVKLDEATRTALAKLVETEPQTAPLATPSEASLAQAAAGLASDHQVAELLGLHIEVLARDDKTVPLAALEDQILTRGLDPLERDAAMRSTQVLLLRADYRNQHGLDGLRLLQQLVVLVGHDRGALVHDPDTRETLSVARFEQHILPTDLSGLAAQIVVIPFRDPTHGKGFVRLVTRGMRKLGCVDLELDGLPQDLAVLERATWLLQGLASALVRDAASHGSGVGYQVDESIEITRADVVRAHEGQAPWSSECAACSGSTDVHLVERRPEPTDPVHHRVARVVAPRELSDLDEYLQPIWARAAIEDLFGPTSNAP